MAPKALARVAGLFYAGMGVCFVVAESLRARIMGPGHAEAAADRIRASASLFRVAMAVDLVSCTLFLCTAAALYLLLRRVDVFAAAMMVVLVALGVAVDCASLVNQHAALIVATDADYARALGQGSWVAQLFMSILAPELDRLASSLTFGAIGELVFTLWLIVKGTHTPPAPALVE